MLRNTITNVCQTTSRESEDGRWNGPRFCGREDESGGRIFCQNHVWQESHQWRGIVSGLSHWRIAEKSHFFPVVQRRIGGENCGSGRTGDAGIDREYQYLLLVCKIGMIKSNLLTDKVEKIYDFKCMVYVLNTGLSTEDFSDIKEMDFETVINHLDFFYAA